MFTEVEWHAVGLLSVLLCLYGWCSTASSVRGVISVLIHLVM